MENNELKNVVCYGEKMDDYLINTKGEIFNVNGKSIKGRVNKKYKYVTLKVDDKPKAVAIHRLVAETFLPNKEEGLQVYHKDGDRLNNDASNLEWCTKKENINRMIDNGVINTHSGIYNPSAKLTEDQVNRACQLLTEENDLSLREIAFETGISYEVIRSIRSGHSWHSIAKKYGIEPKQRKRRKDKKFNDYRKGGPLSITLG